MPESQHAAALYQIRERATLHLERDINSLKTLVEDLEAIATIAEGALESFRSSTNKTPANDANEGDDRNRTGGTYRSS